MLREETSTTVERDCHRVLLEFLDAVDGQRFEEAVFHLTEDCHVDAPGQISDGRDNFLVNLRARPAETVLRHFLTNFRLVSADDRTAVSLSYMQIFQQGAAQPHLVDARDDYVRTSGGWKIKNKKVAIAF